MTPNHRHTAVGLSGLGAFTAMSAFARYRSTTRPERELTLAVNRRPAPWLRVPQQLGTPWALGAVAGLAALRRDVGLAVCSALALPAEKGLEILAKRLTQTPRPAQTDPGRVRLRDDAPTEGASFPSGHAAIAAAAAYLAGTSLPPPAALALWAVVPCTGVSRVQQGAHHPLDAIGGICLGTGVAALLLAARPGRLLPTGYRDL